jgi:YD repeat-containing protein
LRTNWTGGRYRRMRLRVNTYDQLDDLANVYQGATLSSGQCVSPGQTRTFTYDALQRLTSANNPESSTVNYTYDGNGNVLTRTDANSVTTTYRYDALNRVGLKQYSGGSPTNSVYCYDGDTSGTHGSSPFRAHQGSRRFRHGAGSPDDRLLNCVRTYLPKLNARSRLI